jgi:hypothetical protein
MLTPEQLAEFGKTVLVPGGMIQAAAILLSLIVSYVPGWREKWAAKDPQFKSLAMLGGVTAISLIIALVSFTGIIPIVPATLGGGITIVASWFLSLITNNTTYQYSPPVASVVVAKASRNLLAEAKAEVKDNPEIP